MSKILIAGVGRSGTTFLVRLFTYLNLDTGLSSGNIESLIDKKCNAGLEYTADAPQRIIKNPRFCLNIQHIINRGIKIEHVIIPIRKLRDSALSRQRLGQGVSGGLWNANNLESQMNYYYKCIATLIQDLTLNNIPYTTIHFDRMVNEPQYLFGVLVKIFPEIKPEEFFSAYDTASHFSKRK